MKGTVLVVGASIAGVRTAQALRREGHGGPIVLVGAESELPYDKPPLSKAVLLDTDAEPAPLLSLAEATRSEIALELGAQASELDLAAMRVGLTDGRELHFDQLVIATGASARSSPWGNPQGLHVLRTAGDARRLRADLANGGRLVVVGGGFIGAEVAAAASALGLTVSIVDPLPVPMGRALGDETGHLFVDLHHRKGVHTYFGTGVEAIDAGADALRLTLTDATILEAETVVVGIGTVLNDAWLRSSGLALEDGVLCDEYSRSVSHPNVYAVGDIARWHHTRHGDAVRIEHWTNAVEQASCVAHNITHPECPSIYAPIEYVWSDQYDWKIQIIGCPWRGAESVRIGEDPSEGRFAVLWSTPSGTLCGALTVNWAKAALRSRRGLAAGAALSTIHDELTAVQAR